MNKQDKFRRRLAEDFVDTVAKKSGVTLSPEEREESIKASEKEIKKHVG